MEDYDTDEEGEEMKTETASRLFGSGNPGDVLCMTPVICMFTHDPADIMRRLTSCTQSKTLSGRSQGDVMIHVLLLSCSAI